MLSSQYLQSLIMIITLFIKHLLITKFTKCFDRQSKGTISKQGHATHRAITKPTLTSRILKYSKGIKKSKTK